MNFINNKHDYSIKSKEVYSSEKRTQIEKNHEEAEAEEYLKLINSRDKKESEVIEKVQELEDNLQKLYVKDLAKVYEKSNLAYNLQFKNLSIFTTENILSQIETNSVVVIQGPTGCGKTTQIPQLILNASIKKRLNCNIIVTQPRRIAAINIAKRVSQEGGWPLGSLVGYRVGMQREVSSETRLTYCTTEILLQNLIHQKHMFNFTHVILDEIHERDQNLDFLLLIIKKLLQTNSRQVKVILMSATINETRFAKYFSSQVGNNLVPAPTIKIKDIRRFEICTYYLDEIENLGTIPKVFANKPNITEAMIHFCSLIINALDEIDKNDDKEDSDSSFTRHAVLIFLPGIYEIEELYNYLSSVYYEDKLWDLLILHSFISSDEQHLIFLKPPKGYRRIILSTNIGESSITVPDVKYVIDFCLVKILKVDPVTHYESLELNWASKANCEQRAGRTGRVMDGRVYRLIPKAFYDNILNNESIPEMVHAPLANTVLRAKVLDLDEPRVLLSLSLDPPPLSNLTTTVMTLKEIGALVNEDDSFQPYDGKLTDLGRIMAFLPLNIRISKLIMLGHVFGVLRDAIILGASMTVKNIFDVQYSGVSSYINRRKWARNTDSDCIAILNIYKTWQNEKANRRLSSYQAERQWARRNGIQPKVLHELDVMVNEITCRLQRLGITESFGVNKVVWQAADRDFVLQVILAGAFYPNYFVKRPQNVEDFKENITRCVSTADPMKTVYLRGWPMDQPGYLYAQKIQEIFSRHQGIPEKQIAISFDKSTRVFVQFREKKMTVNDENLYNISNFVYQAIKMKQCNVPFEIKLLNTKAASEMARHHNLHRFERRLFFQKGVKKTDIDIHKIRPELPRLDVTFIPLFLQTIISPGYFWSTLNDDATCEKLQFIERKLNEHPLKKLVSLPHISTIIAAPMERENFFTYHRAVIEELTSVREGPIDIFFIDYGYSSQVRFSDLREINDVKILEIPCLAFRCSLACLRPSNQVNPYGRWSKISKNYFETQIRKSRKIFGKIYSVVDDTVNLELMAVDNRKNKLNINEDLIEKEYAVRKEESHLSNFNHELRTNNIYAMSTEEKEFYEEEQYDKDYLLKYPEPPKEEDCDFYTRLQGPYSPLEIEMVQLINAGKSKRISVEMNSVNSVLLDDPDQSRRLLVAQTINQRSDDHLVLRDTTFLPNIPGLATLLVLSFAPRMELRCNSRKTCYTGALCGLGPMDDCTGQAMFPDHDMEIQFDVEILIDDMNEINKLRYWMNEGMQLHDDSNDSNAHIINCQNRLQRALLELRNRQRELQNLPTDDDVDCCSNKWNRYNKSLFLPSTRETTRKCDIYSLHKVLALIEKDEKTEEILKNLSELQRLAREDVQKAKNVTAFCKLCEVETYGLLELRGHLYSKQHVKNEETLVIKRN